MKPTIVISAYKAHQYILPMWKSFAKQDVNMVIGVDGCRDTLRAATRIAKNNFSLLWFPENSGPYIVYNTIMFEYLKDNPYCVFFGADDIALPCLAEQHKKHMTQYDIVTQKPTNHPSPAKGAFGVWREKFVDIGGFLPWRCNADEEFTNRARRNKFSFINLPVPTFTWRRHKNQLTKSKATKMGSDLRNAYKKKMNTTYAKTMRIEPTTTNYTVIHERLGD